MKKFFYAPIMLISCLGGVNSVEPKTARIFLCNKDHGSMVARKVNSRSLNALMDGAQNYTVEIRLQYDESPLFGIADETNANLLEDYYTSRNEAFVSSLSIDYDNYYCSKYTRYVFLNFSDRQVEEINTLIQTLENDNRVDRAVFYRDEDLGLSNQECVAGQYNTSYDYDPTQTYNFYNPNSVRAKYENYENCSYDGTGITIGLLDIGKLDLTLLASDAIDVANASILNDTYTNNDSDLHPTRLASLIASSHGGIAPGAAIKFVDAGYNYHPSRIEYFTPGSVDVVTITLTFDTLDLQFETGDLQAEMTYIHDLSNSTGIPYIAAAGNHNEFRASPLTYTVTHLSNSPNITTVGSIDVYGNPSSFSAHASGEGFSPGFDHQLVKPNLVAVGEKRIIPGFTGLYSGTSYAAAAVAGLAAVIMQKTGLTYNNYQLTSLLMGLTSETNISKDSKTVHYIEMHYDDYEGRYWWEDHNKTMTMYNDYFSNSNITMRTGAGAIRFSNINKYNETSAFGTYHPMLNGNSSYEYSFTATSAGYWTIGTVAQMTSSNDYFIMQDKFKVHLNVNPGTSTDSYISASCNVTFYRLYLLANIPVRITLINMSSTPVSGNYAFRIIKYID